MSEAGVEPGTDRLGRPMKTRPTILRSSVKAAISESQQTATLDNVSLSKRPIAHPQGPALKRTTCGDLTNEGNRNTMKAPRKQPMRSMREAEVAESTSEDMLNWFLPEDGLSRTSDTVAEAGSSESEEVPQERSLSEQSVPRPFHLAVSDRLEERAMPGAYTEDIFKYMRQREKHFALMNYMHHQPELNVQMRAILVDWMVEVQECYELSLETLYLAVKMVDGFLSKQPCLRDCLQLLGASCLLIAAKFQEFCPLYVDEVLYICADSYRREELLRMERTVLQVLNFDINVPTAYRFLRHFAQGSEVGSRTLTLACYICELSLQDYSYVDERASCVASACLRLAVRMGSPDGKRGTMKRAGSHAERGPTGLLGRLNQTVREQPHNKLHVIYSKYSHRLSFEVAKIPALGAAGLEELVPGEESS